MPAGSALGGFLWWRVNTLLGPERTHVSVFHSDADHRAALETAGPEGLVGCVGGWCVLFENCTVDASIFIFIVCRLKCL